MLREIATVLSSGPDARVDVDHLAEKFGLDQRTASAVTGTLRDAGFMAALDQAIGRAPEGPQKTCLQKIRDGFLSAGRDLIVDVAGGVLTGQIA
ncbi:hypothetical protein GCU60_03775 [Blastococcus saxobsidens]|uniref:Uncharacterized protein n=1 Tax=Blastococcus saxobsidens TaxID=138336 RepID=A0A6L9VYM4_9ACTN|nr:hypothetical protein [Blastococcus saxobsidens]NEK84886.1 hypothetical protein [Blastococcus saxobsidens]